MRWTEVFTVIHRGDGRVCGGKTLPDGLAITVESR